jgi:hypothetical protein
VRESTHGITNQELTTIEREEGSPRRKRKKNPRPKQHAPSTRDKEALRKLSEQDRKSSWSYGERDEG